MECFGDSSDDEIGENEMVIKRDESCGICSFHPNTEASLLTHVRNSIKPLTSPVSPSALDKRTGDVLEAVDSFCTSRHWMMHVGPEKGDILLDSLRDAIDEKAKRSPPESDAPFVAVELGTYCGYASILMGRAFRAAEPAAVDCHLHTAEIDRGYVEIASEMIGMSGLEDLVSVLQISYDGHDTDVVSVVGKSLRGGDDSKRGDRTAAIDFLFIDHDKDAYKSDLCKLEASGMIRRGTKVVADNVLFACIDDYMRYVQRRKAEGIVETRTIPCHVEYSGGGDVQAGEAQLHRDGIEITDYLQDP